MERKKVLLVYAVPRSGHAQAACALRDELLAQGHEVKELHLLQRWPHIGQIGPLVYRLLIRRASPVWGHMHGNRGYGVFVRWFVRVCAWTDAMGIRSVMRRWSPDAIVTTHFFSLLLLGEDVKRHRIQAPVYAVPTDFGLHPYWAHSHIQSYFVAGETAKRDLVRAGVDADRIEITGIPIRKAFHHLPSRANARRALALHPSRPTILVMGGSYGFFPFLDVLAYLLKHQARLPYQWVFLFGGYAEGVTRAQAMIAARGASDIHVYGFRDDMPACMAAADLTLSKAGGITTSEVLAAELPSIIYRPLPGQERINVRVLAQGGVASVARSVPHAMQLIIDLMESPKKRLECANAARALAHPFAAAEIVKNIVA